MNRSIMQCGMVQLTQPDKSCMCGIYPVAYTG